MSWRAARRACRVSRGRRDATAAREGGFTLVELLVSITILGVIIAPLTAGLIVTFRTSGDTMTRLASSSDAQALTIVLPPDIESAGNATNDVVAAPTANTECSGVTNVLRLRWTTTDSGASVTYMAAYAVVGNATSWKLTRSYCVGAAAATTRIIARNLANATAATAAVSGTKIAMTVTEAKTATTPTAYVFTVSGYRRTP